VATGAESTTRGFVEGLARAFAGAILFALPLMMTMEMWWLGFYMSPYRLVVLLAVFYPVLVGLSYYIGFDETAHLGHAALHAVIAYGVAFVSAAVMLGALGVFSREMGWHELVGKSSVQAGPAALGALLAQAHFGSPPSHEDRRRGARYIGHLFFMIAGALYFALTVAPTDEMPLIGFMMRNAHTIATAGFALLVLHLFMQGFGFDSHAAAQEQGAWSVFVRLTVVAYALALCVSTFLLWIFGRFEGSSVASALQTIIVLALPASVGAGAARITLDAP
jgi:putative integral membrane protein (TIGR02587 family)